MEKEIEEANIMEEENEERNSTQETHAAKDMNDGKAGKHGLEDPKYDAASYTKMVKRSERDCSGCDVAIGIGGETYHCNHCTNGHVLCRNCMVSPEDESLLATECKHGVYKDAESYEMCVASTYSFMDAGKPKKKCSTCGEQKKPTASKPIYYCRKCRLHRVCMACWNKSQLKMTENV
jgi:hypothetical protein